MSSTLREYPDVEQHSDEWIELRRGIITGSEASRIVTPTLKIAANDAVRGILSRIVAERINGWCLPTFIGHDMMRGLLDEPVARAAYAKHHNVEVREIGFMAREWDGGLRIGYSPDGLVGDDGLIEIKSRLPKRQVSTVLAGEVPADCMAQIQCGLLVSDRAWCDYVSFSGGMHLWGKRVEPDPDYQAAILEAALDLEQQARQMVAAYEEAVTGLPMTERSIYDTELVV